MNDEITIEKKNPLPLLVAVILGIGALILTLAVFVQYRVHTTGLAL